MIEDPVNRTPRPGMQALQSHFLGGGFMQDYPGPFPGTPEFRAALQAGQHPIRDWLQQQRQARMEARPDRPVRPLTAGIQALGEPPHQDLIQPNVALGDGDRRRPTPTVMQRRRPTPVIAR